MHSTDISPRQLGRNWLASPSPPPPQKPGAIRRGASRPVAVPRTLPPRALWGKGGELAAAARPAAERPALPLRLLISLDVVSVSQGRLRASRSAGRTATRARAPSPARRSARLQSCCCHCRRGASPAASAQPRRSLGPPGSVHPGQLRIGGSRGGVGLAAGPVGRPGPCKERRGRYIWEMGAQDESEGVSGEGERGVGTDGRGRTDGRGKQDQNFNHVDGGR
jgi:hypothetical protein